MRLGRLLLYLVAPLLITACATLPPPLPPQMPPAEEVLRQVDARQQALQGLKGLAHVKVSSTENTLMSQQVLFARRPAFLRIESLSPLGTPILYAVTNGQNLNLYLPGENRYYRGPFRPSSLPLALPPDLTSEEIVSFLLGGLPRRDFERVSIRADREEGLWVLDLLSPSRGESRTLWVVPQDYQILRAEFHLHRFSYQAAFSDFSRVKEILFPRQMLLTSVDPRMEISVEFREMELNPAWEAEDFLLPVPRGATVFPLP